MITLHVTSLAAPPGPLWLAGTARGVLRVGFGEVPALAIDTELERLEIAAVRRSSGPLAPWRGALCAYLAGGPAPDAPLDVEARTAFASRVWKAVAAVRYGTVRSFDAIARAAGAPRGARGVGRVLARNPVPIFIPCHRVVSKTGAARGYVGGIAWKRFLLELESRQLRLVRPREGGRRARRRT